jgi:undecaprenyl-diphosphatase
MFLQTQTAPSFLDQLIEKDRDLLVELNALGSNQWDGFWLFITNQFNWTPVFIVVLALVFKYYGWKKALVIVLCIALCVTFADQFVNLIKNSVERLRPNRDPSLNQIIRVVKNSGSYSFVSGHATNSFANTIFLILTLRKHTKWIYLLLIWPFLFAYSRVYLGVHFPLDITAGMGVGILIGITFYKLSRWILTKQFNEV